MKKSALIAIFLLVLTNCSVSVARSSGQDEPPPPANEYFPKTWVEYRSREGKFKIKFPKTPHESSETQEGDGGPSTVYIAEHKGLLLYVSTFADAAAPITDAKKFLNNIDQAWLDANSARNLHVMKNEEVSFGGFPARFLQVETSRDVVRVRWVVVNGRVYYQFVAAPKHQNALESENGYEKLAMAFFNSFELNEMMLITGWAYDGPTRLCTKSSFGYSRSCSGGAICL